MKKTKGDLRAISLNLSIYARVRRVLEAPALFTVFRFGAAFTADLLLEVVARFGAAVRFAVVVVLLAAVRLELAVLLAAVPLEVADLLAVVLLEAALLFGAAVRFAVADLLAAVPFEAVLLFVAAVRFEVAVFLAPALVDADFLVPVVVPAALLVAVRLVAPLVAAVRFVPAARLAVVFLFLPVAFEAPALVAINSVPSFIVVLLLAAVPREVCLLAVLRLPVVFLAVFRFVVPPPKAPSTPRNSRRSAAEYPRAFAKWEPSLPFLVHSLPLQTCGAKPPSLPALACLDDTPALLRAVVFFAIFSPF